eukprot:g4834.t1
MTFMILNLSRHLSSRSSRFSFAACRWKTSLKDQVFDQKTVGGKNLDRLLVDATKNIDKKNHGEILKLLELCSRSQDRELTSLNQFLQSCSRTGVFFRPPVGSFSPKEVICLLTSLSKLHKKSRLKEKSILTGSRGVLQGLSFHLSPMLKQRQFLPWQVAKLVYSLGILCHQYSPLNNQIISLVQDTEFLKSLKPSDLSCLVYGLAQLNLTDFYTREKLTRVILDDIGLGVFSDQDLAALFYASVKLNWKNSQIDRKLAEEVTYWMRVRSYDSKTLSSVCYSLGNLSESSRPKLGALVGHLKKDRVLTGLDSQALVHVAHGLGKSGVKDSEFWTRLGSEISKKRRLKKFTEQGLATLISTFGSIQDSIECWTVLLEEASKANRLKSFQNTSLMNIFIGLKSCSFKNYPIFVKLLKEVVKPSRMESMTVKQLTALVLCIGQYPSSPDTLIRSVFFEIFHCSRRLQLDPQIISLAIYSLGKLDRKLMSIKEITLFLERSLESGIIREFSPQGLSCLLFGLGELKFPFKSQLLQALVEQVIILGLKNFNTFELCNVVFGLGRCGFSSSKTAGVFLNELLQKKRLEEMTMMNLATLILALSYHQIQDQDAVESVLDRILHPSNSGKLGVDEISRILFALSKLQYPNFTRVEILMKEFLSHEQTSAEAISHVLNSLAELGFKDAQIWTSVLERTTPDEINSISLEGLSNLIYSLSKVEAGGQKLRISIVQRLMKPVKIRSLKPIGLVKVLEAVVMSPHDHDLDTIIGYLLQKLLKRRIFPASTRVII